MNSLYLDLERVDLRCRAVLLHKGTQMQNKFWGPIFLLHAKIIFRTKMFLIKITIKNKIICMYLKTTIFWYFEKFLKCEKALDRNELTITNEKLPLFCK